MPTESPIPKDSPLWIAWSRYKESSDFRNSARWAKEPEHRLGSFWAMFMAGFLAANPEGARSPRSASPTGMLPEEEVPLHAMHPGKWDARPKADDPKLWRVISPLDFKCYRAALVIDNIAEETAKALVHNHELLTKAIEAQKEQSHV